MASLGFEGLRALMEMMGDEHPARSHPKPAMDRTAWETRHISAAINVVMRKILEDPGASNAVHFSPKGYRRYRVSIRMQPIRARYSWRQLLWHDTHRLPVRQRWMRRITQTWRHYQLPMIHVDRDQGGYMSEYPNHTDVLSVSAFSLRAEINHFRGNQPFLRERFSWWTRDGEDDWRRNLRVGRWEVRW